MAGSDTYTYPLLSLSYTHLYVTVRLGVSGRYKRVSEAVDASDVQVIFLSPNRTETCTALERVALSFSSDISNATVAADIAEVTAGKAPIESPTVSDLIDILYIYGREFEETATASEVFDLLLTYGRVFEDSAAVTDVASNIVDKVEAEAPVAVEQAIRSFSTAKIDSGTAVDASSLALSTPKGDSAVLSDEQVLNYGAARLEILGASETHTKDLLAPYIETPVVIDVPSIDVQISFSEIVSLADLFISGANSERDFSDLSYATDDFLGEANLDDDQIMLFAKRALEHVSAADTLTRVASFVRAPAEQPNSTDIAAKYTAAGKTDAATSQEVLALSFASTEIDSATPSDSSVFELASARPDTAVSTESIIYALEAALTNSASVGQVTNIGFIRPLSDSGQPFDAEVKLFGPVRSDSASASDSGSLLSQGYVDNPYYFAEDYVGEIRYFN